MQVDNEFKDVRRGRHRTQLWQLQRKWELQTLHCGGWMRMGRELKDLHRNTHIHHPDHTYPTYTHPAHACPGNTLLF
jgi:hypothetical protein